MLNAKRRAAALQTGVRRWRIAGEGGGARRPEELFGVNGVSMRTAYAGPASRAYGESIGSADRCRVPARGRGAARNTAADPAHRAGPGRAARRSPTRPPRPDRPVRTRRRALRVFPRHRSVLAYDEFIASCRAAGYSPAIVQEASGISALGFVAAGLGVTVVAASYQALCLEGVRFAPVAGHQLTLQGRLGRRQHQHRPASIPGNRPADSKPDRPHPCRRPAGGRALTTEPTTVPAPAGQQPTHRGARRATGA